MQRHAMWTPITRPGLEHLKLTELPKRVTVSSLIIGIDKDAPYRVRYEVGCDPDWQVRRLDIDLLDLAAPQGLYLVSDGAGDWATADGEPLPALAGCLDVDISATPFTNTLPIRRLKLKKGESAQINVVYITLPSLEYKALQQNYTCLDLHDTGGVYRYESPAHNFSADLITDRDGFVVDYPGQFRRVLPDGGH